VWAAAAAYRADVEAAVVASVLETPSGLRTVPIFPATHELIKAGNWTARNYYVLTGCNLLEHGFFRIDSPYADLIWRFIEGADGLVPATSAARFDYPHVWDEEWVGDKHHRGDSIHTQSEHTLFAQADTETRVTAPPVDPPLPGKELGMDHAYTYGYWRHRLRQGDPTPAITGLYSALAFGSSATFASVEVTLMDGSNCDTLPHLYSNTQQLRLLRDLVLFEEIELGTVSLGGNLSVGWGIPQQWLADADAAPVTLTGAPTVFGSVTLSISRNVGTANGLTASITVDPPRGQASLAAAGLAFVRLRLRPQPDWGGLVAVTVDSHPAAAVGRDLVELSSNLFGGGKTVVVVALYG